MSNDRMPRRGVLLIVASPSGAGKTSLCRRLMADHGGLELSVSMTTRPIRPGEQAGRDYHFVDEAEFQRLIEADAFLEWANVHGNLYGSPRAPVDRALAEGRDVLFDIDWQGAREVAPEFDYVFVNDDFDRSYAELAHIYHAERSRRFRNVWVSGYQQALLNEKV